MKKLKGQSEAELKIPSGITNASRETKQNVLGVLVQYVASNASEKVAIAHARDIGFVYVSHLFAPNFLGENFLVGDWLDMDIITSKTSVQKQEGCWWRAIRVSFHFDQGLPIRRRIAGGSSMEAVSIPAIKTTQYDTYGFLWSEEFGRIYMSQYETAGFTQLGSSESLSQVTCNIVTLFGSSEFPDCGWKAVGVFSSESEEPGNFPSLHSFTGAVVVSAFPGHVFAQIRNTPIVRQDDLIFISFNDFYQDLRGRPFDRVVKIHDTLDIVIAPTIAGHRNRWRAVYASPTADIANKTGAAIRKMCGSQQILPPSQPIYEAEASSQSNLAQAREKTVAVNGIIGLCVNVADVVKDPGFSIRRKDGLHDIAIESEPKTAPWGKQPPWVNEQAKPETKREELLIELDDSAYSLPGIPNFNKPLTSQPFEALPTSGSLIPMHSTSVSSDWPVLNSSFRSQSTSIITPESFSSQNNPLLEMDISANFAHRNSTVIVDTRDMGTQTEALSEWNIIECCRADPDILQLICNNPDILQAITQYSHLRG